MTERREEAERREDESVGRKATASNGTIQAGILQSSGSCGAEHMLH